MTLRKKKILELEKKALDRSLWGTGFGKGYGPLARYAT
jgi:hypothetical protein